MSLSLRFEHPEKQRYYHVVISQDMFGDWVITKAWGGISKSSGRIIHFPCTDKEHADKLLEKIIKVRIQRGYILRQQSV